MNKKTRVKTIVLLAALFGLAGLLGGCGGGGGGDEEVPIPKLSYTKDYLTYGETLEVVITKPDEGELITNISEGDLGINIEQQPCEPANALCVRWLITPTQHAVAGDYRIGVGHRTTTWDVIVYDKFGYDQRPNDFAEIYFKLLPAKAAPPAISLAVGEKVSVAVTADGNVWAWGDLSWVSRVAPVPGMKYPITDKPRRTGISNATQVFFPRGDAYRFYVYKTDGSVDAYLDKGTLSAHDVTRVGPLRNEDGTLATDIREISSDGRALLNNGEVRYIQDNKLFVGLTEYCPLSGGLEGHVVQIDGYSAPIENRRPNLFLRDDGTVVLMNKNIPSCGWTQIALTNVVQIQTSLSVGFALRSDGTVWVWDYDDPTRLSQVPGLVDIVEISSGTEIFDVEINSGTEIFARDSLGRVFETNAYWSTGTNGFEFSSVDTMPGVNGTTAIASRKGNALALLGDCATGGRVLSWNGAIGSGVFDVLQNSTPRPVIGIGDADPSCSRLALFYPSTRLDSPDKELPFFRVDTHTGNMTCGNDLCWELVPPNSSLLTSVVSVDNTFSIQPTWDCEAAGNSLGQSFTLGIADRDVYCKLVTDAYRFIAGVYITGDGTGDGSITYPLDTDPAGWLARKFRTTFAYQQVAILDSGTAFQLIAPPTISDLTFIGFSGDCTVDGQVVMPARDAECDAHYYTSSRNVLSVVIEGGPGAGTVISADVPQTINCRNTGEITTICGQRFPSDSEVELRAIPTDSNSQVTWSGCTPGVNAQNQPVCRVSMDTAHVVTASFAPAPPTGDTTLTVIIEGGPGVGEVTSDETPMPLMDCFSSYNSATTTCTATYAQGSDVVLYALPTDSNSSIAWTGCTEGYDDFERTVCALTMDTDHTVVVNIQPAAPTHSLTLTIDGQPTPGTNVFATAGGVTKAYCTITPVNPTGRTCTYDIPEGDVLLFDWYTPGGLGNPVQAWSGCTPELDANNRSVCRLTMDGDHVVTATFGP